MKKLITILLYGLFLALLAEFGVGWLGYRITQGKAYSYDELKEERLALIATNAVPERAASDIDQQWMKKSKKSRRTEILHPYLGFVIDSHDNECPDVGFCDDRMRGYKKMLQGRDFPEPDPKRVIIAVTGGSVAYGVANNSSSGKLEQALATIPALKDKEIIVYTFALGGYKQPQQLFTVGYYLALGAHFDMIINIDGFNDIVLPQAENIPFGTNPFFPRVWHNRIRWGGEDYQGKILQGLKAYLTEQRTLMAAKMNSSILRKSTLMNLVWKIRDSEINKRLAEDVTKAESDYLKNAKDISGNSVISKLISAGTKFPHEDKKIVLEQIAEFWRRSSEQMNALAKTYHIQYYHFLQPNQYVENSKPMSADEKKTAIMENHPYAGPARLGYPYLIAKGELLKKSGVPFHDLTMMFKDNNEVLYRDACCHFNEKGYDLIIDEIAKNIQEDSSNQQNQKL